ncbi:MULTISPECIES: DUF5615 family PIN-like protein [unclassified Okeania]|uniref:DUF5615 family PIN-like protein n=1 Tax=unclassified Okeania TaxID=2634635 RepID=UPI00257D0D5C|nr:MULTISPECIES: DUF5615 family PIN-like protein [unclassified Okeania]
MYVTCKDASAHCYTTSAEALLIGASDEQQLGYALSEKRVIFTFDDDFLSLAATGIEHSGIIYTRQQRQSIGKIISDLVLIWECLEPEYMYKKIEFL